MKIYELFIKNFRNLKSLSFNPGQQLNILLGDNAQGKTNILEAIYVLATGNSFRSRDDKKLINYDADSYILKAGYTSEEKYINCLTEYKEQKKSIMINGKKTHNHIDRLRVVLFTPDDLYLIKGAPSLRRHFIDFAMQQLSNEYYQNFNQYVKILKKRNFLLKTNQYNNSYFDILNNLFIETATKLIINRINFINIFEEEVQQIYSILSNKSNNLKIRYALSFPVDSGKINLDILKETLKKYLHLSKDKEINKKTTFLGPHLDDIHIYLDDRITKSYASQGQQRNIVIALKLAEINTFHKIKGFYPVLLLDEVLSELDEEKKMLLIEFLNEAKFQTILTAVDNTMLKLCKKSTLSMVSNGSITRKE